MPNCPILIAVQCQYWSDLSCFPVELARELLVRNALPFGEILSLAPPPSSFLKAS